MAFKLTVEGEENVIAALENKVREIEIKITEGLKESGDFLKTEVEESIRGNRSEPRSVDTGEFADSIQVIQTGNEINVFSEVPQAKFMEFGTSRITPRGHFMNSTARSKDKIVSIITEKIK